MPLALAAGALLSAACGGGGPQANAADGDRGARPREAPRVEVAPVERREMIQWLETTAVVESEREVQVLPRAAGIVREIHCEEGDAVEAGQVLATLEAEDQQLAVRDAEVALEESKNSRVRLEITAQEAAARIVGLTKAAEQAKRDHDRNVKLFQGESGGTTGLPAALSEKAVEESQLAVDRAQSDQKQAELSAQRAKVEASSAATAVTRAEVTLEKARVSLSYREIRAPFAGVIARRNVRVGDSASAAQAAFALTDPEALRVVIPRPQRELPLFLAHAAASDEPGADAFLRLSARAEAIPGRVFRGEVQRTSPTVDPASGSFRVTARIHPESQADDEVEHGANGNVPDAEAPRLLPGMLVRVRIATARHAGALVVPKRALTREGDRSFLLAVRDGKVWRVAAVEGFAGDEDVEVLPVGGAALEPGEMVVVVGSREIEDGTTVQVVDPSAAPASEPAPASELPAPASELPASEPPAETKPEGSAAAEPAPDDTAAAEPAPDDTAAAEPAAGADS